MKMVAATFVICGLATTVLACGSAPVEEAAPQDSEVSTRRCPTTLTAEFGNFETMTLDTIERDEGFELSDDDRKTLGEQLDRVEKLSSYSVSLGLTNAKDAQCTYEMASGKNGTTAKFYTNNGQTILRIDAREENANLLSFYVQIKTYAADHWSIDSNTQSLIMYREADSEGAFRPRKLGHARSVSLGSSKSSAQ